MHVHELGNVSILELSLVALAHRLPRAAVLSHATIYDASVRGTSFLVLLVATSSVCITNLLSCSAQPIA